MTAWFALVDTAADDRLWPLLQRCEQRACLISGALDPALAAAAPYLVALNDNEPLLGIWRAHGQGKAWGMLCEADVPLDALRKHFRQFLRVMLPSGAAVQFRFYDPRVFASYLPAAPPVEQARWFEGVRQFSVEAADGGERQFRWRGGRLFDGDTPLAA